MTDMVILASTSSTRQAMLRNAGLNFIPDPPRVDERALADHHPAWTPQDMAIGLAEAKAVEVSSRHVTSIVIGADQVVAGATVHRVVAGPGKDGVVAQVAVHQIVIAQPAIAAHDIVALAADRVVELGVRVAI